MELRNNGNLHTQTTATLPDIQMANNASVFKSPANQTLKPLADLGNRAKEPKL